MRKTRNLAGLPVSLAGFVLFWAAGVCASPTELEEGVLFEGFEDGKLDAWQVEGGHAEIEEENGNKVLEVRGAKLWLKDKTLKDFCLEARVRREYQSNGGNAGFLFRDKYRLYIQLMGILKLDGPAGVVSGGLTRGINTDTYRKLKIVCAGPIVRFYVDGEYEGEAASVSPEGGRIGLFGGTDALNVYFDDVKLSTHVSPGEYLAVEPQTPDECLVFAPDKNVELSFKVSNRSDARQQADLGVTVQTWAGEVLKECPGKQTALDAGGEQTVTFDLGRLPAGYYKMLVKPTDRVLPLAVQERGSGEYERPDVVIGAYWYYKHWELPTVMWKTYVHAAARQLKDNHFNMVVSHIGMPAETMDILQQYGISVLTRGEHLDHPAALGAFISDEPKPEDIPKLKEQYAKAREKAPDKILTTCMVGDGGLRGHVFEAWKELVPMGKVRMFRWYGIKKCWEGINRQREGRPAFTEILRQAREPEGPFWVILQSFGGDGSDAYFGNPLASEVKAMMHLSMANGAQGLVFYTYQSPGGQDGVGFVGSLSLAPVDDKWAAAGKVAANVARHAKMLKSLKCEGSEAYVDDYAIEAYRFSNEADRYLYVVNKDPRRAVSFRIFKLTPGGVMRDLYADRDLPIYSETVELLRPGVKIETGVVHLSLGPGDGTLLKYLPPKDQVVTAAPRVKYPDWLEGAPADKCKHLIDLKTENTPVPGWVPGQDHQKNPWHSLNADTKLFASMTDPGQEYKKSLYAHAETTIVYKLPEGYSHFVAAAGFGAAQPKASVIFRVLVDGKDKYNSGVVRMGHPVLPVVVEIAGAKKLELITEEAGDGLYQDYTWWGEARLVKKD